MSTEASKPEVKNPNSRVDWGGRILVAMLITAILMYFSPELNERYGAWAIAMGFALIIMTAVMVMFSGIPQAPVAVNFKSHRPMIWEIFTLITGAARRRVIHGSGFSEPDSRYETFKLIVSAYLLILTIWWTPVGVMEFVALPFWHTTDWANVWDTVVSFGPTIIAAGGLMASAWSFLALRRLKRTMLENRARLQRFEIVNRYYQEAHGAVINSLAWVITNLRHDRRPGDKRFGQMRFDLEDALNKLVPDEMARDAVLMRAQRRYEEQEARLKSA